jgi:chromosome segregation ATPase
MITSEMQDAIEKALQSKTENLNRQISEMESAMAGMREHLRTLNERHTLAMDIVADKSNTIRILSENLANSRASVKHYRSEMERFEKARDYWRNRYQVVAGKFYSLSLRLGDFETWLGLKFRSDVWDYSNVEDFSQE